MVKSSITPRSRIKSALRNLWLRSRERASALKYSNYCCELCGVKQSKAKGKEQRVEVHHKIREIDWNALVDIVKKDLLCDYKDLQVLCPNCHDKITYGTRKQNTSFFG